MAKPPLLPMRAMSSLRWMSPHRPPEALHWTVMPDPAHADAPGKPCAAVEDWTVATIAAVLAELDAAPFTLVFDRATGKANGHAELLCRKVPPAARRLVAALRQAFASRGIVLARGCRPHVTLDYAYTGAAFDLAIGPIVWEVDRLELIESIPRPRRHVVHAAAPLVPRQGTLFPLRPCDAARGTLAAPAR